MKYGVTYAGPRRTRMRRDWRGTLLTVLTLLTLAALCGWLWSCVREAVGSVSGFRFQVSGLPLAMAPVPAKGDGAVLAVVLLGMAAVIWLSVLAEQKLEKIEQRKRETRLTEIDQETEERWRRVRRKQREILQRRAVETVPRESWTMGPLESLSEAETEIIERLPKPAVEDDGDWRWGAVTADGKDGNEGNDDVPVSPSHSLPVSQSLSLPLEDLRRIVGALRVEMRSARDLVMAADGTWSDEEARECVREALASLHKCVGCVDGLAEAVGGGLKDEGSKMKDERGARA